MGYVYLLNSWDDIENQYKIGVSKHENIELKRIKSLQTGNAYEIVLIKKYKSIHYRRIETMLHRYFTPNHTRGEWFDLSDEQVFEFIHKCEEFDKTITLLLKENPFYK